MMPLKVWNVLFFGLLCAQGATGSSSSDYTDSIIYSVTSPFRSTIEFIEHVWDHFVDLICFPFLTLISVLQSVIDGIADICLILIDRVNLTLETIIFQPLMFVIKCLDTLVDMLLLQPLLFLTDIIAGTVSRLLTYVRITSVESNVGDVIANILAFPVDKFVNILHVIVHLFIAKPLELLFQWVIDFLLVNGIKLLISAFSAALCAIAEISKLPILGISILLKNLVAIPLDSLLSIICFILFCLIDPIVYFFYLVITFLKLCILGFAIVASIVYIYNYKFSDPNIDKAIKYVKNISYRFTRRLTFVGRRYFGIDNTAPEAVVDDDDNCCAVCFEERLLIKLIPCGHETTCMSCLQKILRLNRTCPICRSVIQGYEY